MKLLFNYLKHSMKEGDSIINSKTTPNKSNGSPSKVSKSNGNTKISRTRPSTSGTDIKLTKFFGSFKVSRSPITNGYTDLSTANKKQCDSQTNGTPKKRSNSGSAKSSSNSMKSTPTKSPQSPTKKKLTSLSTSASASAKKRAIERVLKKKDPTSTSKVRRRLTLDDLEHRKNKKKREIGESSEKIHEGINGRTKRRKLSPKTPESKKSRNRANSGSSDDSGKVRPRRRASQTYFFKYQLARNPLKAEEEDLKQALLASLEQCGQPSSTSSKKQQQLLNDLLIQDQSSNTSTNSKTTRHSHRENHHQKQPRKQNPKRPPNNKHSKTSSLSIAQNIVPITPATVATSTPPTYDEEYLEKYRPDTEDFLTFICFRVTAPNFPPRQHEHKSTELTANSRTNLSNGYKNNNGSSSIITGSLNIKIEPPTPSNCVPATSSSVDSPMLNDNHSNSRRSASPYKMNSNSVLSIASNQLSSPSSNRRRPPTRQSPRLANNTQQQQQQQKISDFGSDSGTNRSQIQNNCNTALNPIIDYEEDLKRASIALEDMAQEITKDNVDTLTAASATTTRQQNGKSSHSQNLLISTADVIDSQQPHYNHRPDFNNAQISAYNVTTLPFKGSKHLVKGLMTREFAGTFADEEIIFESISNHKL